MMTGTMTGMMTDAAGIESAGRRVVTQADVYVAGALAGHLNRTKTGSTFRYSDTFAAPVPPSPGVAFALPPRTSPYEIHGYNLHPFFAGLLPEGLRLRALERRAKTSADDLLGLLLAAGPETIGDVSVVPAGEVPRETTPIVDLGALDELSFRELFDQTLEPYGPVDASIPGVQNKVSAAMISMPLRARKRRGKRHERYILKLTPPHLPQLVENEHFFMTMAAACGLTTAHVELAHDGAGESALLVRRFDRVRAKAGPLRTHQEDVCQLLERYPADKYNLSMRDVMDALGVCSAPIVERARALELCAFSVLIANGDLHARNVSVRVDPTARRVHLTPAYDLLSTLPYGDDRMALPLDGRDKKISGEQLVQFGVRHGVSERSTRKMLKRLVERAAPFLDGLRKIGLDDRQTTHLRREIEERMQRLADPR